MTFFEHRLPIMPLILGTKYTQVKNELCAVWLNCVGTINDGKRILILALLDQRRTEISKRGNSIWHTIQRSPKFTFCLDPTLALQITQPTKKVFFRLCKRIFAIASH
jgi:hypothetical protein